MKLVTIVAASASEALAEVHRQLGPEAVVVNVRKTPAPGLSRIWKQPRIEVQATLPIPPSRPPDTKLADLTRSLEKLRQQRANSAFSAAAKPRPSAPAAVGKETHSAQRNESGGQRPSNSGGELGLGKMLENLGILPLHAQWLVDQVHARQLTDSPQTLRDQFVSVQEILVEHWSRLAEGRGVGTQRTRVLVGTSGVGKTTCLCKWLTQEVLLQNRSARVWRLDGSTANTAEFLSIHGEILGVSVERVWPPEPGAEAVQLQFVDLPGISAENREAINALAEQVEMFQPAQVLLVLNSAYDFAHLVTHARAFASLPLDGLILTHLDEDSRWSKFWNLLLGTGLPVLYLSGGQNIPGDFAPASPHTLFDIGLERETV